MDTFDTLTSILYIPLMHKRALLMSSERKPGGKYEVKYLSEKHSTSNVVGICPSAKS
jgi:hypothetical protein